MQEQEMIDLIRERNEKGMEELLKHYGPLMRYIIAPILNDRQDQEECLSEAAMRIWEKIDWYHSGRGTWSAWLTAVTRNTALNRVRQNKQAASMEEISTELPSKEPTPEETFLMKERQAAVSRALQQLPQKERLLFYRKYYYMQSTAQIASELGMTERAVEGKLYRLKKRLRKILGGEGYE